MATGENDELGGTTVDGETGEFEESTRPSGHHQNHTTVRTPPTDWIGTAGIEEGPFEEWERTRRPVNGLPLHSQSTSTISSRGCGP